jgi:hypothetical protein
MAAEASYSWPKYKREEAKAIMEHCGSGATPEQIQVALDHIPDAGKMVPDFGYIVEPANVHQGVRRWHVKRLDAEFGDSVVAVCFDEEMAQHIRSLLQKDMKQRELRAALHGARVSVSDAEDDGA